MADIDQKTGGDPKERAIKTRRKERTDRNHITSKHGMFKHQQLDNPDSHIRLVEVLDFQDEKPIQCLIKSIHKDKAKEGSYRALSYHWGDRGQPVDIDLNGKKFKVHRNLYAFLEHAAKMRVQGRAGWTTGLYWIDALCIDQDDSIMNSEKPIQLKHMRDVYEFAHQTYIWLGGQDEKMKLAFQHLELIQSEMKGRKSANVTGDNVGRWVYNASYRSQVDNKGKLIKAMTTVIESAYWERVWILQEIAVSDSARLHSSPTKDRIKLIYGDHEIEWRVFTALTLIIQVLRSQRTSIRQLQERMIRTQGVWLICWLFAQAQNAPSPLPGLEVEAGHRLDLPLLIFLSERSKASRPQDYIYGLIGLDQRDWRDVISPEDNSSGCQVLCRVIEEMLKGRYRTIGGTMFVRDVKRLALVRDLKKLGREARHGEGRSRPDCCGSDCRQENGSTCGMSHHCNALLVCRNMARRMYKDANLLTLTPKKPAGTSTRFSGGAFHIGRDFVQKDESVATKGGIKISDVVTFGLAALFVVGVVSSHRRRKRGGSGGGSSQASSDVASVQKDGFSMKFDSSKGFNLDLGQPKSLKAAPGSKISNAAPKRTSKPPSTEQTETENLRVEEDQISSALVLDPHTKPS